MSIYAIGDLHLSFDERVEKPMDKFGSDWRGHADRLKEIWLSMISDDDLVLIPGDISWGLRLEEAMADLEWIDALPGKKIISKGNHDLWWVTMKKLDGLCRTVTFLKNNAVHAGGGTWICGARGWTCPGADDYTEHDEKMYRRELIRFELSLGEAKSAGAEDIIAMLHYPPMNDMFADSGFTELMEKYGVKTCIYGHLHGMWNFRRGFKGSRNGIDYKLVSLDYLRCVPERIR